MRSFGAVEDDFNLTGLDQAEVFFQHEFNPLGIALAGDFFFQLEIFLEKKGSTVFERGNFLMESGELPPFFQRKTGPDTAAQHK